MAGSWSNTAQNLIQLVEQVSGYSGIFGYSPAPGTGNLVFSLAAASGVDPYGNHYPQGLSIGNDQTPQIVLNYTGTSSLITFAANNGHGQSTGTILEAILNGGQPNEYLSLQMVGPSITTFQNKVRIELNSQQFDGGSNANLVVLADGFGNLLTLDQTLMDVLVPLSVAGDATVSGNVLIGGYAEASGQNWNTPTYNANWSGTTTFGTIAGGLGTLRYRKDAEDNLWLLGTFTAAAGAGNSVFNLPAAYRPKTNYAFPVAFISSGGTPGNAWMYVSTAGNLNINSQLGSSTVAGNAYTINAKIPLGNIT